MTRLARSLALTIALAFGATAATTHVADACGGYSVTPITEGDRATWALQAFLGELGQRVSFGAARLAGATRAEIVVDMNARTAHGRAKVRQTYLLEKRGEVWQVVDWTVPVAAPVKLARSNR